MTDMQALQRSAVTPLTRYLAFLALAATAVLTLIPTVWPPQVGPTSLALAGLFAVVEASPVLIRRRTRSEFVVLGEIVMGATVVALDPGSAVTVGLGGALLVPVAVRLLAPLERMQRGPGSRYLMVVCKNVLGLLPMLVLGIAARPWGLVVSAGAVLLGAMAHGVVSHLMVAWAIRTASGDAQALQPTAVTEPVALAFPVTVGAIVLGVLIAAYEPAWPLALLLAAGAALISRSRMQQDLASHRLTTTTTASEEFAACDSVADLDHLLRLTALRTLRGSTVALTAIAPHATGDRLISRVGATGPWLCVEGHSLGGRWTRLDDELLHALAAMAAPHRERLALLHETIEAERFASLVLTTAGHDMTNQLQAATMAIGTATRWPDRLDEADRQRLAGHAVRAIHRASSSLRDLVAIGASGPGAATTAAEIALFVRGLDLEVHVVCDNVVMAAPAAVVERAVENLVRNAQRHHAGDEPLTVCLVDEGATVAIEVCDRGPGLAAEHVETLFAPFTQLADDRGRRGPLGLGLFIARGLAESVGGALDYRDRDGGGAVFVLRVPSVAQDATERVHERIVLGPRPDGDAQAPLEPRLGGEVTDQDALAE